MTRPRLVISILFAVLTVFHLAATWSQTVATVLPDEVSYLAQARYFAGKDERPDTARFLKHESFLAGKEDLPSTEGWPYYHFGYSLIVSPIYWLTNSPTSAYRGVMIVNSLLLSSLFLIIYSWIRVISQVDRKTAISIGFITSLYPAYILQAQIGWAENALIPGCALSCLLLARHLKYGTLYTVVLFACVAGLQFTLHPRGLLVVVAAIVSLLALSMVRKEQWKESLVGVLIIVGIFLVTKIVANELSMMMNTTQQEVSIIKKITSLIDKQIIPALIGNLYYLTLATLGVFLLGVNEGIRQILDKGTKNIKGIVSDVNTGSILFVVLASSMTFAVGIIFLAKSNEWNDMANNLDMIMYGRYNENFLSIYIALGLLWLCRACEQGIQRYAKILNTSFWLVAVSGILFSMYLADYSGLRSMHAFGLFPWSFISLHAKGWWYIAPLFILPLLWTYIALQLFIEKRNKGLLTIAIYFFLLNISMIVYKTPALQVL